MAYRAQAYQYETSPRKLKPEYEPKRNPYSKKKSSTLKQKTKKEQKNESKKEKRSLKSQVKTVLYILLGFSILFAISYRNSLITEGFNKNENLKKQLGMLQKENAQIEISIQSSLNLANIEKSAIDLLGMQKVSEAQKVYVTLPKKDYVEPASESVNTMQEKAWWEKIIDTILGSI